MVRGPAILLVAAPPARGDDASTIVDVRWKVPMTSSELAEDSERCVSLRVQLRIARLVLRAHGGPSSPAAVLSFPWYSPPKA